MFTSTSSRGRCSSPRSCRCCRDPSHANAKDVLASADNVVRFLDREGVERVCCINYVSPDVMGFTRETNDWIANFTRDHRDRLLPVGSVNPLHEINVRDEIRRVLDLGIRMIKIHPPHQLFSPNAYHGELWQLAEIYRECEERRRAGDVSHRDLGLSARAQRLRRSDADR